MKEKIKTKVEELAERLFLFYDSDWGWREKMMVTGIAAATGVLIGVLVASLFKTPSDKKLEALKEENVEEA